MKAITKFLCVMLALVMVLGLGACGKTDSVEKPDATTGEIDAPGTLQLVSELQVSLHYDEKGKIVAITGDNANGETAISTLTDAKGMDCVEALQAVLKAIFKKSVVPHGPSLLIRQAPGSVTPSKTFLESVTTEAKLIADEVPVIVVAATDLDEHGMFDIEVAKQLLLAYLGNPEGAQLRTNGNLMDNCYNILCVQGEAATDYLVHAEFGLIQEYQEDAEASSSETGADTATMPESDSITSEISTDNPEENNNSAEYTPSEEDMAGVPYDDQT